MRNALFFILVIFLCCRPTFFQVPSRFEHGDSLRRDLFGFPILRVAPHSGRPALYLKAAEAGQLDRFPFLQRLRDGGQQAVHGGGAVLFPQAGALRHAFNHFLFVHSSSCFWQGALVCRFFPAFPGRLAKRIITFVPWQKLG